jgi:hypothetical protein
MLWKREEVEAEAFFSGVKYFWEADKTPDKKFFNNRRGQARQLLLPGTHVICASFPTSSGTAASPGTRLFDLVPRLTGAACSVC